MRPVVLEMNGFASFREPTTVDFRGAEYFALVGPTGSGKSTVIDAMTFALYGSVPRWDDRRTVSLALAPTAGRGAVKFVFDVGGARYVVARELRRSASGGVSVRTARLERLRDPAGLGGVDEETEPLADGAGPVTKAVEELLGLPFGDFTTCVVLPQGEFAEFLHTEPRKRQEKLVRILGLGVYDVIAKEANSEAASQRQRAEILTEQLGSYADATEDAEKAAAARVDELTALASRVDAVLPELTAAGAALDAACALVTGLHEERSRLAALAVPAGVADLDARQRTASDAATAAAEAATAAEAADTALREQLAAAPARGPLEQARRDHAELAALTAELPGARERHLKTRHAEETAAREALAARSALDTARAARDTAAAAVEAAREAGRRLAAERDALRTPTLPAGLDALDQRRSGAAGALERAEEALAAAEAADTRARAALAEAPPRGPLEQARRERRDLDAALAEERDAAARLTAAQAAVTAAEERVAAAGAHVEHSQAQRDGYLRSELAAALRPVLVAGHDCPVCAQPVVTLPAPLPEADRAGLDAAEAAVTTAVREHDAARAAESEARAAAARAAGETDRIGAALERLRTALAAAPADVDAALAELDRLALAVEEADAAARAARRAREAAAQEADAVRREAESATAALRAARDPLVGLGAPAVEAGEDVLAGWASLVSWARAEATARDGELPAARAAFTAAEAERVTAEEAVAAAERAAADRHREETAAARAEQDAAGAVTRIDDRLTQLGAALAAAPADAEAAAELARLTELEAATRAADGELRAARVAQRAADRLVAEVGLEVTAASEALRSARDALVPLGAPAVGRRDLLAAWSALTEWAHAEADARAGRLVEAERSAEQARAARAGVEQRIVEDLATHDVALGEPVGSARLPAAVQSSVAAARERARAAQERIAERRASAGTILADRDAAESAQQVAKLLGNLLRSDGFPRWLVASALDALVADASRSLADLSGGQFELTHDNGEFLIIDHADADSRRPVKTLSGGETFQASLALALALSSQMSSLAAQGAARLESIFLDEGFGTLDEANLEVVASTLENLATRGDRVVGVITHVPALAERVPVRFAVSRDQRTSSVVREGM
ncbi:SMC family ATPase [Pseudonocardia sp.]|jgi:exonuclease SbcC|uniref:AAA family ATPase n=1 Tax=Pseudonocardia sp. TaxID=60912 RepID=UPI0025E69E2B|nr:SMC family ATPase [Pseudonocardia sp.]